jgi:hypothetical protein
MYKGKAQGTKAEQVCTTKGFLEDTQDAMCLNNKLTDSDAEEFVAKRLYLIKVYIAGQVV